MKGRNETREEKVSGSSKTKGEQEKEGGKPTNLHRWVRRTLPRSFPSRSTVLLIRTITPPLLVRMLHLLYRRKQSKEVSSPSSDEENDASSGNRNETHLLLFPLQLSMMILHLLLLL